MSRASKSQQPDGVGRPQGVLVASKDSGGLFALMEYEIAPRMLVAPLHTHRHEDEYSYVLGGSLGAQVGDQTCEAGPHGLIAKPRGTPHTLWNPGEVPTRVLELIVPGGFERCLAELYRPGGPPSAVRLRELWVEYGIDMDSESVPELLHRHGLRGSAMPS